jgi:hypothetical protein
MRRRPRALRHPAQRRRCGRPRAARSEEAAPAHRTRPGLHPEEPALDGLFDDTEPDEQDSVLEDVGGIEQSSSFRRYVSEGIALLEDWLREPE